MAEESAGDIVEELNVGKMVQAINERKGVEVTDHPDSDDVGGSLAHFVSSVAYDDEVVNEAGL